MKKLRGKRGIAAGLAVILLFATLSGCGSGNSGLSSDPGGGKWVDSDVVGYVKADQEIRLQDDFAAAANKEWILEKAADFDDIETGSLADAGKFVSARYRELLEDETVTGGNAEVLRTLEELTVNWEERDRLGVEPLRGLIENIEEIGSIDELTEYQGSFDKNPYNLGLIMPSGVDVKTQFVDQSLLVLKTPTLMLGDAGGYEGFNAARLDTKERNEELISYFLKRLGYDERRIKEILKGNYRIETFIARHINTYGARETFNLVESDRETMSGYLTGYPLFEILDARGFSACDSFSADYLYLAALHDIYNEANLENLKSFLIVHQVYAAQSVLDRESVEKALELSLSKADKNAKFVVPTDDDFFVTVLKSGYMPAMDTVYLEKYFGDNDKIEFYTGILNDLIEAYHQMIDEVDWMTLESKAAAQDKLDNMAVHVIAPDNTADYSTVDIKGYAEGGTLLDAVIEGKRVMLEHTIELAESPVHDRFFWDIYNIDGSTTAVNSYYSPSENAFYILAGWTAVADYLYGEDASYEQILGCVATTMGHEISHGFDASGSQADKYGRIYDEEGNTIDWMDTDSRTKLNERADRLASYYSLVRPIPGKNKIAGTRIRNEAMADMAGLKACLYLAKKYPGFDYDAFFRAYAALWATLRSEDNEALYMEGDEHPLAYLRINIGLQQFDEFLETYGIEPGDGMYLASERRVAVW